MAEDVDEEASVGFEQRRHLRHQRLVVAHVLEHLDRDDAIEAAVELEIVGVGRDDRDVRGRSSLDPLALHARVGDGRDARAGVALGRVERERAPAAAEVEDLHAVLEARALAGEGEHRLLRLGERRRAVLPEARAVLQSWPENELEERRRLLVVLLVRLRRLERDRLEAEPLHVCAALGRALAVLDAESPGEVRANAGTDDGLGEDASLDDRVDDAHRASTTCASCSRPVRKSASHEAR